MALRLKFFGGINLFFFSLQPIFSLKPMAYRGLKPVTIWERQGFWCPPWTSNPVFPATSGEGGFDSHTLPPYKGFRLKA